MIANLESEITKHLERLCVEIGPRPIGSGGNHAAADYIKRVFRSIGLDVEEQPYDCPNWNCRETQLTLNGEEIEAAANAFSPPCDVRAQGVAVGSVAELEKAHLTGLIGILHGNLTQSYLSPKSWFLLSQREARIIQLLEEKEPAALVTVQPRAGMLDRIIVDWEFLISSASVPAQAGLALLRHPNPTLHLQIESQQSPGYTANIVARKRGNSRARIVLCAHYDTTFDTPGAADNAGGVAVLLALAQRLSQEELPLSLEFIAFTGHEYLPLGDDEYMCRDDDGFEQVAVAVNFDGAGEYVGANSITMMSSSQLFQDHVGELTNRYPGVVWVDPWPQSNHSTFAMRGVPSIAFSSTGGAYRHHLRDDTINWVSPAKLNEIVSLVAEIVDSVQDKPLDWMRESAESLSGN